VFFAAGVGVGEELAVSEALLGELVVDETAALKPPEVPVLVDEAAGEVTVGTVLDGVSDPVVDPDDDPNIVLGIDDPDVKEGRNDVDEGDGPAGR